MDEDSLKSVSFLQSEIERIEQNMARMFGMEIYKPNGEFTFQDLYSYAGRTDDVCTLTLSKGSESATKYGEQITVVFVYILEERKALEKNPSSLNNYTHIKAKGLDSNLDKEQEDELQTVGVKIKDIIQIVVLHSTPENNTFPSREMRKPSIVEISFEVDGRGKDIFWIYGMLRNFRKKGIGLTPDENAQYLAYKLVLEPDNLTSDEHSIIFNEQNLIYNQNVAYHYLLWKEDANKLKLGEKEKLEQLRENRLNERAAKVEKALEDMGLSWEKLTKRYLGHAMLLFQKIWRFQEIRFNMTGKHPLYMDFETMLHIYLRHVKELEVKEQFSGKDKFQLEESDIIPVMKIVMSELNDEYQLYKDEHPDGRFRRTGKMAYYYNGDYYNVYVGANGRVETFFKGTGRKE